MNALVLDPGDGRETGLRLARHEPLRLPEPPPRPAAAAIEVLGELSLGLVDEVAEKARRLADAGVRLDLVDMRSSGRWVDDSGQRRYLLEVTATYEIRCPRHVLNDLFT